MANTGIDFHDFQMIYACYKIAEKNDLDNETLEEALQGLDMMIENLELGENKNPGAPDNLNRFDFAELGKAWNSMSDEEKQAQKELAKKIITDNHKDIGFAYWMVPHDRNAFDHILRDYYAIRGV